MVGDCVMADVGGEPADLGIWGTFHAEEPVKDGTVSVAGE
jgi:hypothetical protein